MKARVCSVCAGWVVAFGAVALGEAEPAPVVGWTREAVVETMGEPRGYVSVGALELLYYARGRIHLRDGVVESAVLVSTEEAARQREAREARRAREREAEDALRQARVEDGLAERERLLDRLRGDPLAPAAEVALWEDFTRRFPEVPVADLLAAARSRMVEAREREQLRRRMIELEERTLEAERRAWAAEEAARLDRRRIVWIDTYRPRPTYACPERSFSVRVDWQPTDRLRLRWHSGGGIDGGWSPRRRPATSTGWGDGVETSSW